MASGILGLVLLLVSLSEISSKSHHDYCVVGGGPGGIQLGYYLHKANRDYVIYEKSKVPGNFYTTYPRHRTLISINKRYSGQMNSKFNMRHDWNSLLSDNPDLRFTKYTSEFFPKADLLLKYLEDFSTHYSLNIRYDSKISAIKKIKKDDGQIFTMRDQNENKLTCKILIIATGLFKPNIPKMVGSDLMVGYEDISVDPKDYTGKSILIVGRGNAAFETADSMLHETNFIHMMSRSRAKLAWSTHYVGDLRAINNNFLDNYQLKSLDGLLESPIENLALEKNSRGKIFVNISKSNLQSSETARSLLRDNYALRSEYDMVIRCMGFKSDFSIFDESAKPEVAYNGKYPKLKGTYESENIPGLFFGGAMGHSVDYKMSAGGFIHGYRYTARTLHYILESVYEGKMWKSTEYDITDLSNAIVKRLNEADSLYQMFSTLGDVITFDRKTMKFRHYEDYPISTLPSFKELTNADLESKEFLVLNFEYGKNFSGPGKDTFYYDRAVGEAENAHRSNFLHPVLYYYRTLPTAEDMKNRGEKEVLPRPNFLHHIVEDFLTDFSAPTMHLVPLRRFLESVIKADLRNHNSDFCLTELMTSSSLSLNCLRNSILF